MYKQTEDYYKTLMLGFGNESVYNVGCYLVSLISGINKFGHKLTPREFNQLLKDKNLFIGEYKNYIDVDNLATKLPYMFSSFKKIEPWNDMATLKWYLSRDYVVLGKVDAKGIGGSGTHFVLVDDTDGDNAIIHDPWTDEYQPVANRYNKYGNILGLRIFGMVKAQSNNDVPEGIYYENIEGIGPIDFGVKEQVDRFIAEYQSERERLIEEKGKTSNLERDKGILEKQVVDLESEKRSIETKFGLAEKAWSDREKDLQTELAKWKKECNRLNNRSGAELIIEGISKLFKK